MDDNLSCKCNGLNIKVISPCLLGLYSYIKLFSAHKPFPHVHPFQWFGFIKPYNEYVLPNLFIIFHETLKNRLRPWFMFLIKTKQKVKLIKLDLETKHRHTFLCITYILDNKLCSLWLFVNEIGFKISSCYLNTNIHCYHYFLLPDDIYRWIISP